MVVGCGDTDAKPNCNSNSKHGSDTLYVRHAVCTVDSIQAKYSQLDQAQHLDVTAFRFRQIVQHTGTDDVLQEL